MMDRNVLAKEFIEAVAEMRRTHGCGTYYWIIGEDEKNDWAIVLGWGNGFDEEPNDDCTDGTWRLCAKLAYQPNNSMQCDYDVDWDMPYDKESGEVDDNEVSIYPNTDLQSVVNWLLECYDSYFKEEQIMKKYSVVIHYEGGWHFEVEAKDEDTAKEIAEAQFADLSPKELINNLADTFVCDCWEH